MRRVVDIALRLEDSPPERESRRLDKNMIRLEHAVDAAVLARGEATVAAGRLSDALEAVAQGVVICDEGGDVVTRNAAATTLEAERYGDGPVGSVVDDMLQRAIEGKAEKRTLELFGPARRTLVVSVTPIDDERRTVGGFAVIDDVSERRRLEAIRRDFVANVSHELKTPVAALGLLADTLATEDDPIVGRRLAQRMVGNAIRLGRMIDDLLELSRIEAEQTPVREPVPVHLVVAEAVEQVRSDRGARRRRGARRGGAAHVDRHGRPASDRVGRSSILLDNAVKYSDTGSSVDLRVAVTEGDDHVNIEVRDQGAGIPSRDHERVFERFYRVDRGRSDVPGTGLGLAIVRHVADNLGGDVRLESREGEGSTFTLVLPGGPTASGGGRPTRNRPPSPGRADAAAPRARSTASAGALYH